MMDKIYSFPRGSNQEANISYLLLYFCQEHSQSSRKGAPVGSMPAGSVEANPDI